MSEDLFQSDSPAGVDLYRWIAPIYDPMAGPFLKLVRRAVNRVAGDCGCRRILDIGCGTGEQAQMLANSGFSVTGIDLSPAMLARALQRRRKAVYVLGDAGELPFPSSFFDCVLISLALHEMNYQAAARVTYEAIRVLVPGGKLVVFDYLRPRDFTSRLCLAMLHVIERLAGKNHFTNFQYFVDHGGLEEFLKQFSLESISGQPFFGGTIGLVVSEKRGGTRISGHPHRQIEQDH